MAYTSAWNTVVYCPRLRVILIRGLKKSLLRDRRCLNVKYENAIFLELIMTEVTGCTELLLLDWLVDTPSFTEP
jgi:hypothetical protein